MIWGKTPPPLCDFVQWLDTEQSQQDKDHVERQVRWAAQRWQRMLHEEQMEEKRKKNQEEIQKRIAEVERQKAEEREADRERKLIGLCFIIVALFTKLYCKPKIYDS